MTTIRNGSGYTFIYMEPKLPLLKLYKSIHENKKATELVEDLFDGLLTFDEGIKHIPGLMQGAIDIGHIYPRESEETIVDDGKDRVTFTLEGLAYYDEHKHLLNEGTDN